MYLTLLHLGNEVLVEETSGLLVQWAVDGNNITLSQHLFQAVYTSASDLFLELRLEWLVVEVQELLAIEWLQSAQHTLTNPTNGNGTDHLVLQVVLVLGHTSNIPVTALDHLVGRNEVSDKVEDGHDDVFGDGDDVRAGDLSDSYTAIGLVGCVQVDVVGTNTGSDGNFEVLGLGQSLGG